MDIVLDPERWKIGGKSRSLLVQGLCQQGLSCVIELWIHVLG